ncbi:IclR family transcriptional regulator, partial [Vibrio cholerae O1 biovar El Tor]|nr:IclR family transcriptional regulator [Vibrio cholerae O1 biovar El Tor]
TDPDVLLRQLADVRTEGYATEDGEMELGVRCVAVPVPSEQGNFSISLSAPESRLTDDVRDRALPVLRTVAERLAEQLEPGAA